MGMVTYWIGLPKDHLRFVDIKLLLLYFGCYISKSFGKNSGTLDPARQRAARQPRFETVSPMRNARAIWKHEVEQADKIARSLIERDEGDSRWKKSVLLFLLGGKAQFRKDLKRTRKNLLFTKRLAFEAAKEIFGGKAHAEEMRHIEIKTKKLLEKEKGGFYTDKVRRKQLHEVGLLVEHYLDLLNSNKAHYKEMIRATYPSPKKYLSFLNKLLDAEQEVIQATLATMRKGTKKDRLSWFKKVQDTCNNVRMNEAERIFPEAQE